MRKSLCYEGSFLIPTELVIIRLPRFVEKFEPEWNSLSGTETRVNSQGYDSFRYAFFC